jgi:putative oxidoreductase
VKKYPPTVAGVLLGLLFAAASIPVLFKLAPMPKLAEGTPEAMFLTVFGTTGYLTFVKVLELCGGILVSIPRTRNIGLLVLGAIIVNILAYHIFIKHGDGLQNPMLIMVVVLALYLLWVGRRKFADLLN